MVRIPYKVFPDRFGAHVYSTLLSVSLSLPDANAPRTKRFEAIIDSGAARCLFHADIGRYLGLEIQRGMAEPTQGIGGTTNVYLHKVNCLSPVGL